MWNRRRDEDVQPRPQPVVPSPAPEATAREMMAPPPPPSRSFDEPATVRGSAMIGKSVVIKGHITSREDLYIDGELEGTLEVRDNSVTVGKTGKVTTSSIVAKEVVVLGRVHGNVEATEIIEIRKDATLIGDLRTARIKIDDGAMFKGSVDIVRPEPKPQPKVASAAQPTVAEPARQQTLTPNAGADKK
jgi:cytoskeletal protein CcmA (bactofilin family)